MRRAGAALLLGCVVGAGSVTGAFAQTVAQAPENPEYVERRAALEQKMGFAGQVLFQAAGARRVAASDNEDAREILREARELFTRARAAIDARNLVAADDLVSESLRMVARAVRMVPDADQDLQQQRLRFSRSLEEMQTFQASHLISMKQISEAPTGATRPPELEQVRDLMAEAQTLAEAGKYGEAQKTLARAAEVITGAAPKLMAGRAAEYEIRFPSASAEFEFENARFHSYEDLVPIALMYFRPKDDRTQEIQAVVDEARRIHEQSRELAVAGAFDRAARMSEQATARVQRALRLAGVALQEP